VREIELVSSTSVDLSSLVTLSKLQSRIPSVSTIDDSILALYLHAAIAMIESVAEITLTQKVFNLNMSDWPNMGIPSRYSDTWLQVRLETTPVTAVNWIKYYDETDTLQTFTDYETWLSHSPPSVLIGLSNLPVSLSSTKLKAITIQYTAGYTSVASLPPGSKLAVLELVAYWYQNREAFGRMPDGVQGRVFQALIDTLRWRVYP